MGTQENVCEAAPDDQKMRHDIDAAKVGHSDSFALGDRDEQRSNKRFRNAVLDHANDELRFTIEKSNTGTSSIRASIYRGLPTKFGQDL
jgi:hypothetical protein